MAASLISNTGRAGPGTTSEIDTSGVGLLIIGVGDGSGPSPVPTDSKNNIWAPMMEVASGGSFYRSQMWCVMNPIVGSGHTFTVATDWVAFSVAAFSGPFTFHFEIQGTASNMAITPAEESCLLVTNLVTDVIGDPASIDGGFTITNHFAGVVGVNAGQGMAYFFQTAAALVDINWSITNEVNHAGTIAVFKKRANPHAGYVAPVLKF